MKKYIIMTSILSAVMILLPFSAKISLQKEDKAIQDSFITTTDKTDTKEKDDEIKVLRTSTGNIINLSVFEYLVGTVAGEMPASFSFEALKAQTVVSYTYFKWLKENSDESAEYISDSSSVHQKYIDRAEQQEKWQDTYEENRKRIEEAVKSVYGEYLTYNNSPAMTVFHALSSGKTLSAAEVWGEAVAYLPQVEAPGDILAEKYENEVSFTPEEFRELFNEEGAGIEGEDFTHWASVKEKNDDGYIRRLAVGSKEFTSRQIRKLLSLPSESFKARLEDSLFVFTVHGKGHGVGMSQYSADYMAHQGTNYKEILAHFYPGTTLSKE